MDADERGSTDKISKISASLCVHLRQNMMQAYTYTIEDARRFEEDREYLKAADIYQELGELEHARRLYLALECQQPFNKPIKFKLGKVLTQLHEWDEAVLRLQEVQHVGLLLEETLYLLAECFRNKGLIYAAKETYVELVERNYHYKDAKEKLQALERPGLSQLTTLHPSSSLTSSPEDRRKNAYQTMQGISVEDRYMLIEELGRGGMGIVYKAADQSSGQIVAIKVLPPYLADDEMNRVRFFREADIIAKLRHPHIVRIFETNPQENFIVMEYLPGGTLSTWKREHPSASRPLLLFIVHILGALQAAHQQGIIHRDLKPENILIAEKNIAKLTDFGIAHICGATITHTGTHLGTLPYMSPEQILGRHIDHRADLYSVGVMLYELITGNLPFTGNDTSYHHIHTLPRPPRKLVPTLAPKLNTIIIKCLAKNPDDRYQDGTSLQTELIAYLKKSQMQELSPQGE